MTSEAEHDSLKDLLGNRDDLTPELKAELEEILAMETEVLSEDAALNPDTFFEFEVSDTKMELILRLLPTEDEGSEPDVDGIMDELMKQPFTCGFDVDLIAEALQKYPLLNPIEVVVGRGKPAEYGRDGWLEFHVENPLDAHQLEEDQTGKVDYRSHRHIIDVVKDQELVTIHPPSEPLMGEDVFGHRVMAKSGRPVSLSSGKNTYLLKENHTIYASTGGCLVAQNGALVVEDLVLVSGDLDMSVGNIETESRVLVQGNVLEGFVIKSSQTVEVKGNVEASSITSQESIVVHGGFLGRGSGILRAKDNISCRFVNHGILCCEGDVVIEDSLMHSTITCGKTLEVVQGQHGLICGGRIRIRDKIVAKRVGARSETQTSFFMGFDYKYESQLHDLDVQLQKSLHHLHELNAQMEMNSKEKKRFAKDSDGFKELAKVEIAFRKEALLIKVELEKLRKHIHTIENKAFLDGVSYFKVTSEVFPNTKLHVYKKSKNIDVYRRGLEVELEAVNGEIRILGATS